MWENIKSELVWFFFQHFLPALCSETNCIPSLMTRVLSSVVVSSINDSVFISPVVPMSCRSHPTLLIWYTFNISKIICLAGYITSDVTVMCNVICVQNCILLLLAFSLYKWPKDYHLMFSVLSGMLSTGGVFLGGTRNFGGRLAGLTLLRSFDVNAGRGSGWAVVGRPSTKCWV